MTRTISRVVIGTLLAGLGPLLAAAPVRAAAPASLAGGQRADVQAAAAVPHGASLAGALASTRSLHITLALRPRDAAALAREAQAVSDPHSASYHHYLDVAQFASRFGARGSGVATVRRTLRQAGLGVSSVSADGLSVTASGTAAEVEGAFDTTLRQVRLADGRAAYTDTATPTLPSAAAALVQGVSGLDSLPVSAPASLMRASHAEPAAPGGATAQVSAGAPSSCHPAARDGNTAQDIASAYGLDTLWNAGDVGAGTTVALYELEPYAASDVAAYQSCYGTSATVTDVPVDGGASCPNSAASCTAEDALDIEDVAGLAPGATIDVYEGPDTGSGAYDTYAAIIQADTAQVISTSWGACEAAETTGTLTAENALFEEAALQGQTVLAASGDDGASSDDGASGCDSPVRGVDDPASQPEVTGVGGTSLPSHESPSTQTVWNDGQGAGGGGVSSDWKLPSYQTDPAANVFGVTCPKSLGSQQMTTNCREVPDVSADADPATGYAIYYDEAWKEYAGTSAAAPTWAALIALADSSSSCTDAGVTVGFANPALYALSSSSPSDFTDITAGDNTFDSVPGYSAETGYDMGSGLGTPNAALLAPALCASGTKGAPPTETTATTETTPTTTTPTTTTTTTTTTPTTTTPTGQPTSPTLTTPVSTTTTTTTITTTTITTTKATHRAAGADVKFAATSHRRRARVGRRVRDRLRARDRLGLRLVYSARRLPAGLRINRRTGIITGVPRHAGRVRSSITARDTAGDAESVVIRWTIVTRR